METPKGRDTELAAMLLPVIVASANRFQARAAEDMEYQDLLDHVHTLLAGVEMFAGEEFEALAPTLISGAREFASTHHLGFVAMGRYIMVQLLAGHPEVMQLAAQRAQAALWNTLCDEGVLETVRKIVGE